MNSVKMLGTVAFALILLGLMFNLWRSQDARGVPPPDRNPTLRDLRLPRHLDPGASRSCSRWLVVVGVTMFLRSTKIGTAMRAIANDREISSLLGVPVRRVETVAWLGSGVLCGIVGLLLVDLFGSLDMVLMTFFVIRALAPMLIGQLTPSVGRRSSPAFVIGIVQAEAERLELGLAVAVPQDDPVRVRGRRRCCGSHASAPS